ncbi:hypothetical protein [Pseudomonas phage Rollin]|nr:hypothetical protein [Pseudomonas phage Rollin]
MGAKETGIRGLRGPIGRWETFWASIEKTDGCWLWRGLVHSTGYGTIVMGGKSRKAHRVMAFWMRKIDSIEHTGSAKTGLVLHSCDNRLCVNPAHLSVGGASKNLSEAYDRGRKLPMGGVKNPRAKLTPTIVRAIRADYAGGLVHAQLADKYDVCQRTINKVVRHVSYKEIV